MKKYFLTTALMGTFIAPAFGAITGGPNTCTVDVLGVYDNNATANTIATWALNNYECGAGQYLVVNGENIACQPCPAGSYCPGGKYTIESENKGTNACPTGYTQSNAGASANTECYTNCTVANANIAHATAVTGNDYYGSGTDTCAPTNCEFGYHVDGKIEVIEKPLIPIGYEEEAEYTVAINADGSTEYKDHTWGYEDTKTEQEVAEAIAKVGLTENNTWAGVFDEGIAYGRASCQPHSSQYAMAREYWNRFDYFDFDFENVAPIRSALESLVGKPITDYLIYGAQSSRKDYFIGGHAIIGMQRDANFSPDSVGEDCYCQVDGYKLNDGDKVAVTSAPWVLLGNRLLGNQPSAESCASNCAAACVYTLLLPVGDIDYRIWSGATLGVFDYEVIGGMCKITENNCPAGQYLAVVGDTMMCAQCPSGAYCPGGTYTFKSENKGANECPSGYTSSDAGASSDTQCYKACTVETANIAHAAKVSGNDYYGTGTDKCHVAECDKGYHIEGGIEVVQKTPLVSIDPNALMGISAINGNGDLEEVYGHMGLTANNTAAALFDDYSALYFRSSCQPTADPAVEYFLMNYTAIFNGSMTIETFESGLRQFAGAAKAKYAASVITDVMNGTKSEADVYAAFIGVFLTDYNANYSTNSSGIYCYGQVDVFMPYLYENVKTDIVGAPWVMVPELFSSAEECAAKCIMSSAELMLQVAPIALGAVDYVETSTCAANTINIDWNPDNGGDHTQNMCLYDGAITLPTPDPVKPGYTFTGWKLLENTTTE